MFKSSICVSKRTVIFQLPILKSNFSLWVSISFNIFSFIQKSKFDSAPLLLRRYIFTAHQSVRLL